MPHAEETFDVTILGSGFAGSLLAMVARRLGYTVLLLERGRHPRFAIGESTTPLANLLLEELAHRYDLPNLLPLTRWGSWQREHPELVCGLKRGFTFYHHELGAEPEAPRSRRDELLVAASPRDEVADTHWLREDVDTYLVKQAEALGVVYLDETRVQSVAREGALHRLSAVRADEPASYQTRFLVDASGPRGALHQLFALGESAVPGMPKTELLYCHFRGVQTTASAWERPLDPESPYPVDDAAVHHVCDGGWMWVLRFGNGVTSAGVAATQDRARSLKLERGGAAWRSLLEQLPAVQAMFRQATPLRDFCYMPQPSYLAARAAGPDWALLPGAAAFVDPLLSTGFALSLLGVERLGAMLALHPALKIESELAEYARQTTADASAVGHLVGALYATMNNFNAFVALCLLYFVAASFTESARRLGRAALAPGFLLCRHAEFGPAMRQLCARAQQLRPRADTDTFVNDVLQAIAPFDVAGLTDRSRSRRYPVLLEDLLESAHKLGASRVEVERMLAGCGLLV